MRTELFKITDENYTLVDSWWKKRNMTSVPKDMLSDYGVMGYINESPLAIAWLYPVLSTSWCMMRFPISDPDSSKEDRNSALDLVFHNIHGIAKDMGYSRIFCTTDNKSLIKRLERYGYIIETQQSCSHLWGGL